MPFKNSLYLVAFIALLMSVTDVVCADFDINGNIDADENYHISLGIDFFRDIDGTIELVATGGALHMSRDTVTKDVYIAFVVPLSVNDNLYGDVKKGSWYPSWYPEWTTTGHSYGDLAESDLGNFEFRGENGSTLYEMNLDYYGVEADKETVDNTPGPEVTYATSFAYNLANVTGDYTVNSPRPEADFEDTTDEFGVYTHPDDGWVYNMIYEFKIDGSVFEGEEDFSLLIGTSHNSPVKLGKKKDFGILLIAPTGDIPDLGGGESVLISYEANAPEPATMTLLALGGIAMLRRRKR
jgi:hypothetical protein